MVFSSLIFLFLFLPVFMAAYYLTPLRHRSWTILIGSCVFYAWWRVDFLLLLMAATGWNYWIAHRILANLGTSRALRWMQTGVVCDLLLLGVFKYFNFGVDSLNAVLEASGMHTIHAMRFILPIGISFYTFQKISFLVDVYRRDAPPPAKFSDFAAFVALFPQLIAGPVLRYKDLAGQFYYREHSFDKFSHGAYRFMTGFAKKVLIADIVADLVEKVFALQSPTMADAWLGALAYTVQLYYDFSGYSDMAVGLALMMGFRFIENFDHPYISHSIMEFWRRWHISLSAWLRDYLYIPLGGNRRGTVQTYINLFLTMLLGGLWHGANWTFIIWGAWHGLILAIEKALGVQADDRGLWRMAGTFFLVVLGWVMFRSETVGQAWILYHAMFTGRMNGFSEEIAWQITASALVAMAAGYAMVFGVPYAEKRLNINIKETRNVGIQCGAILFFALAVIKLGAKSYSPFLYFQF